MQLQTEQARCGSSTACGRKALFWTATHLGMLVRLKFNDKRIAHRILKPQAFILPQPMCLGPR